MKSLSVVAICAAMDWALMQVREKQAIVSGFHSPLEQSVLKVLMSACSPAVAVLARPLQGAKVAPRMDRALGAGAISGG